MNRLLAFGFLVSLVIAFTGASLLVIEEGTPGEGSTTWRQLTIELPPAFFDLSGGVNFEKPIWTRREANATMIFPVLGSLECDETVDMSVAALIDGVWECVDINSPLLPPATTRKRDIDLRASEGKVDPPSCTFDEAPLLWNVSRQMWQCINPDKALIQYVRNAPRPICNDTDLVVYNEAMDWFECRALNMIEFKSTISKTDLRWQVPSTVRHIGSIASSSRVRSGGFSNFRWSNYAFTASTELIAYDQTSPPQVVTTGGANWLAYTIQTSFVGISGTPPYYKTVFSPIYPGTTTAYNNNVTKTATGTIVRGDTLTFSPGVVSFSPSGVNSVTPVGSTFRYNSTSSATGGFVIVPLIDVTVDSGSYPVVEIAETVSNWYVGSTPDFNPNLILTLAMWLSYEEPSGF